MWELGLRLGNSFSGNIYIWFLVQCKLTNNCHVEKKKKYFEYLPPCPLHVGRRIKDWRVGSNSRRIQCPSWRPPWRIWRPSSTTQACYENLKSSHAVWTVTCTWFLSVYWSDLALLNFYFLFFMLVQAPQHRHAMKISKSSQEVGTSTCTWFVSVSWSNLGVLNFYFLFFMIA